MSLQLTQPIETLYYDTAIKELCCHMPFLELASRTCALEELFTLTSF